MNDISNTWFTIVNPYAGSGRKAHIWKKAEKLLEKHGVLNVVGYASDGYRSADQVFDASAAGCRRFIAAGGDGTVHQVLNGIVRYVESSVGTGKRVSLSDFYLAVIPVGSGNDWIRSHGVTHNLDSVIRLLKRGSFALQDVVKVTTGTGSSCMINIGGVGLDARICERVNLQKEQGRKGRLLYINSLVYNLIHYRPSVMSVECDGEKVFEGRCLSIAFGIGKYSGGGLRQTPDAVTDDGLLDYTIIPALPASTIIRKAPRLLTGTFSRIKELTAGRCRTMSVTPLSADGEPVEVDGEIVGNAPVRLEVMPEQINVLHSL